MVSNNEKNPPKGRLAARARKGLHVGLYCPNVTTYYCVDVSCIGDNVTKTSVNFVDMRIFEFRFAFLGQC